MVRIHCKLVRKNDDLNLKIAGLTQSNKIILFQNLLMHFNDFESYINNRNQDQMQQSIVLPVTYENQVFYTLNGQYMVFPGVHYPFCFLNYNHLLNYDMNSNHHTINNHIYIQKSFQQAPLPASITAANCVATQAHITTQNGKQQSSPFPQVQKKTPCVKKHNANLAERSQKDSQQKRGNDRFIKKNTQSNVINQIFSFLWTPQKSKQYLIKIVPNEEKIEIFYHLMRTIKTHCKSQLNRFYLKSLIQSKEWESGLRKLKKKVKKIGHFTPEQLCLIVRKLVYLYLREISLLSIMTSKKMNRQLWKLHLAKCKEIVNFLFQQKTQ